MLFILWIAHSTKYFVILLSNQVLNIARIKEWKLNNEVQLAINCNDPIKTTLRVINCVCSDTDVRSNTN
jgi:hypothetical protein